MGNKPVRREQALDLFHGEGEGTELAAQVEGQVPVVEKEWVDHVPDAAFTFQQLLKVFQLELDCLFDDPGGPCCGRLFKIDTSKNSFGQTVLCLGLNTITTNGEGFIKDTKSFCITEYPDVLRLRDLPLRPIRLDEKEVLKARGRDFVKFATGFHFLETNAKMFFRATLGTTLISAEGRVVVDTASLNHFNPNYATFSGQDTRSRRYEDEMYYDMMSSYYQQFRERSAVPPAKSVPSNSLHLCAPTLGAFSLKAKTWGEVRVDSLRPIKFRDDAFEKLVFPERLKSIIKGLSEQQSRNEYTDIIGEKGGGIVFLLHGVPGVGKSLTAEAVAEFLHKPLYMVDVGELGVTPSVLESNLQAILDLVQKWDAALLIDEADIFLQTRSTTDVLRNSMVGIFLRQLEYHNGVLFLTSNRVEEIDEAFRSRISLALHYRALDRGSRIQVWSNLLEAAEFKLEDPSALENFDLNGRQIKTVIRLAISLAKYLKKDVSIEHIVHTTLLIQEFHANLASLMNRRKK
jgi:hypothetical protein